MPVPGKMCFHPERRHMLSVLWTKGEAAGLYHKTASSEAEICFIFPKLFLPDISKLMALFARTTTK